MRKPFLLAGTSLGLLIVTAPFALAGNLAPIAKRYALADEYVAGKLANMVVDLDLKAQFVASDADVLYRHEGAGQAGIWLADVTTGSARQLVSQALLVQKLGEAGALKSADQKPSSPVKITPIDYDPTTSTLKFTAQGKAWVLATGTGVLAVAPEDTKPAEGVMSPDGRFRVLHSGYNLKLVEVATGHETYLTTDGDYDHRYGMNYPLFADMVAANSETPDMPVSVQWSPDSTQIVTFRLDRNGSYVWHGVQPNPPHSQFPRHFDYVYPTAGAEFVPQAAPLVINISQALKDGHGTVKPLAVPSLPLLWPGDPDLGWDGNHVLYQWTKRGYGEVDEYEIDPASNTVTTRVHEEVKPVVTVTSTAIRPVPELKGDLVISERSGWAQLYYLAAGSDPSGGRPLTTGAWEVSEIKQVTEDGHILITGNGRDANLNPYYSSLYSVTLDGTTRNLTPEPLNHAVTVAGNGKTFIDVMSTPTQAPHTVLRSVEDGHVITELGRADPSALLASGFTVPEPFQTMSQDGKVMLYGLIYRPKNFDKSKNYPVIEYVYTGPTTHIVASDYRMGLSGTINAMAQIGAIVVTIDGRGTSQRGQAFRLPAFQNMGEVGLDDHIWVLKQMKAKYHYFDLERVGVYGHSAGGYDTARFVLRRPDFYKVGVASSGNQDLRLDKAWWPEVSMGLADDATWERNSNVSVAGNLKGHLMLMHGDIDDNVPVAATLRLDKALIDAGKPHELVIMPNRTHDTYTPYFWRKHYDFFTEYLLGETPPPL